MLTPHFASSIAIVLLIALSASFVCLDRCIALGYLFTHTLASIP